MHAAHRNRPFRFIPLRYVLAITLALLEIAAIIAIVFALCRAVPGFSLVVLATQIGCVVRVIASDDNPDYKIPWLLVLSLPAAGFMCYFLFYSRTLKPRYSQRLQDLRAYAYDHDDSALFDRLRAESLTAHNQARMLCSIAETHLFTGTRQTYFPLGEELFARMIPDLQSAEKFIFLEFFIMQDGQLLSDVMRILKAKAASGVEVRVVYDDVGSMFTLPGNYAQTLAKAGILAMPFSRLKGSADSEFNNRSHRKIVVIDGRVAYTGGVNLADEYINAYPKYGHWKDGGIRLQGPAVREMTRLFLIDYGLNAPILPQRGINYFPTVPQEDAGGFLVPFGDGPNPIYQRRVAKNLLQSMIAQANQSVCIQTPYLIIDNDMCQTLENAALRGVNVKIIVPHIPDKRLILEMTRSYYPRLMRAGVQVYEYAPGFLHAKNYLVDDEFGMTGTINLDYRSLVHHFEDGVWMYRCSCLNAMKADFESTLALSIPAQEATRRPPFISKIIRSLVRAFAPLL